MTDYRRVRVPGASYFFTVALATRGTSLLIDHADHLGNCFRSVKRRHPFVMEACVILPDHLHCLWTLPDGDDDFSTRWFLIKSTFSRALPRIEDRNESRRLRGERGIWQRRYWEHLIRDEDDFRNHVATIHINPVKHGLVSRAIDWPQSSIHRHVREGLCDPDWAAEPFVLDMKLE